MRTLKFSTLTFMQDIQRLFQEQQAQVQNYIQNPLPLVNPAVFRARAKAIELLLLLGVTGEHLLKAVLLKHGFILNEEVRGMATQRFPQSLLTRITQLGNSQSQQQIDAIYSTLEDKNATEKEKALARKKADELVEQFIAGRRKAIRMNPQHKYYFGFSLCPKCNKSIFVSKGDKRVKDCPHCGTVLTKRAE